VFLEQCIGLGGATAWPAHFPDLNTFLVWNISDLLLLTKEVNYLYDLKQRIQNQFEKVGTTPGIFQRLKQSMSRRENFCVEGQRGDFGNFL
jgi:hypothetical protein